MMEIMPGDGVLLLWLYFYCHMDLLQFTAQHYDKTVNIDFIQALIQWIDS